MAAVEQRYAQALADLVDGGAVGAEDLRRELDEVAATLHGSPELRRVLDTPAVDWPQKKAVLEAVAAKCKLSRLSRNFLLVAVQRGRVLHLEGIVAAFDQLMLDRQGIVRAEVTSARTLSATEKSAIESELATRLQAKLVTRWQTDPELVGGFLARVGDQIFDGSIRGRLARLRVALSN